MAIIKPFKGIIYNKTRDISKEISPPYDVISPHEQDRYYRLSEYNIIRIILGKEFSSDSENDNRYTRAAKYLSEWLKNEIVVEDDKPFLYIYEQEFVFENKSYVRRGFLALIKLEENGSIKFHENTFSKPKEDRLCLLRACRTNTEPVFSFYEGRLADNIDGETIFEIKDDNNIVHRLLRASDEKQVHNLINAIKGKNVYIADGHHRFETAINYARENNVLPSSDDLKNYTLMCFVSTSDSGLLIQPIHRVLSISDEDTEYIMKNARKYFLIVEIDSVEKLKKAVGQVYGFISRKDNKLYMFKMRDTSSKMKLLKEKSKVHLAQIDAAVLHALLLDDILEKYKHKKTDEFIAYTNDHDEAISLVKKGQMSCAFLLNPVKISQIINVANLGEKMPHKSTFFYPKLASGIIMRKIE